MLKRLLKNNIFRISILYAALFFIASIVMLFIAYKTIEKNITQSIEQEVNSEIIRYIGNYKGSQLGIEENKYAFFIEKHGQKLAGNIKRIPKTPIDKKTDLLEVEAENIVQSSDIEKKGDIVGKTVTLDDNTKIFIGKSSYSANKRQIDILDALSTALLILWAIGAVGGVLISFKSIKRIDSISKISKLIMQGDLSLRIPITNYNDDIEDLASNLNSMLDKIDSLMIGIKQVSNNIAHDLRTPLTRLYGKIESLNLEKDSEYASKSESILAELDMILETFSSILRISRLETGAVNTYEEKINFTNIVIKLVDFYEPLAENKQQKIKTEIEKGIFIKADANLIFQALVNILENAIKYSPKESDILITLKKTNYSKGLYVTLTIKDNGLGVPEEYLDKITDRFFRLEKHRGTGNGNGLGLSLVKAIIDSHCGSLSFKNNNGLIVEVRLPMFKE